ncbi:MAG: ABC transporter ATP-binding protein [Sphaerospermopsis sp. SIO1G2]|nr:ABC transporter ATP-binding protein [Sphaerospermopsis sp. SIO1G2]
MSHHYGALPVIEDISFQVKAGELTCLVGASGCGKSTILRLIAGLEQVQRGEIWHQGELLAGAHHHPSPGVRHIGLVFQHPSLFPHLTVAQNICFGLSHLPRQQQRDICEEMMQLIGLQAYGQQYPHMLSGGQQQRVALARTLAPKPVMMLLDEPFANLDHALRRDLREEVMAMLRRANIPMIMVTHDPEEALVMADHVVLLNQQGKLHQQGSAEHLYHHPRDIEAARFFGHINEIQGVIAGATIQTKLGPLDKATYAPAIEEGRAVMVAARPDGICMARDGEPHAEAMIEHIAHHGAGWLISARLPEGQQVRFQHISASRPQKGECINLTFMPQHCFIFPL